MRTWREFAEEAPELAASGQQLLRDFTLAFVATLRRDGSPRVHPMTVTLHDGGLYVFVVASTPKARDLERDPRYALHAFPPFEPFRDDEFACGGRAVAVDDAALREAVAAAHNDTVHAGDPLYRLDLDRAHHKTRVDGCAVYRRWRS